MTVLFLGLAGILLVVLFIASNKEKETPVPGASQAEQRTAQQVPPPVVLEEPIAYAFHRDQLQVTFDKGKNWVDVPVEKELLFKGEYQGNQQELIENSYILTKARTSFLYTEGTRWDDQEVVLLTTLDQGKTWNKEVVGDFSDFRFRKVDFLNEKFGYVMVSGGRTMSQEGSCVFLTYDGGAHWQPPSGPGTMRLLADGSFTDEQTGFMSYGTINPEKPDLYVTADGGKTWRESVVNVPEQYERKFVAAEAPFREKDHLAMLVNQGPNGDYAGGLVKGKFISKDNGRTWEFQEEMEPETEQ